MPQDALSHLGVDAEGDQERAAGVPGVPQRDDTEAGPASTQPNIRVRFPGSIGVPYFVLKTRP